MRKDTVQYLFESSGIQIVSEVHLLQLLSWNSPSSGSRLCHGEGAYILQWSSGLCHTKLNVPSGPPWEVRQRVILKTSMKVTKNDQPRLGLIGLIPEPRPRDHVSRWVPIDWAIHIIWRDSTWNGDREPSWKLTTCKMKGGGQRQCQPDGSMWSRDLERLDTCNGNWLWEHEISVYWQWKSLS